VRGRAVAWKKTIFCELDALGITGSTPVEVMVYTNLLRFGRLHPVIVT